MLSHSFPCHCLLISLDSADSSHQELIYTLTPSFTYFKQSVGTGYFHTLLSESSLLVDMATRLLHWTLTRQGAGIISAYDRLRRPEDRLQLVFLKQRIAGLQPANPERRAAAVYCGCINGAVLASLAMAGVTAGVAAHY